MEKYLEENKIRKVIREVIHGGYEGGELGDYHTIDDGSDKYFGSSGAGLLAFSENNQILLCKRSTEVNEPGTWSYPGGKIDGEENSKASAQREFEEETGYGGGYHDLKLLDKYVDQGNDFIYYTYTAIVYDFEPVLDWESEEAGWFDLDNLPSPLHFGFKAILPKIKNKNLTTESYNETSASKYIGSKDIGVKDKSGNDIFEGCVIKHNDSLYLIKWSKNQKQYVARKAEGMNWRDFNWIKNLGDKYIEIVGNIHFDEKYFNMWKYLWIK